VDFEAKRQAEKGKCGPAFFAVTRAISGGKREGLEPLRWQSQNGSQATQKESATAPARKLKIGFGFHSAGNFPTKRGGEGKGGLNGQDAINLQKVCIETENKTVEGDEKNFDLFEANQGKGGKEPAQKGGFEGKKVPGGEHKSIMGG